VILRQSHWTRQPQGATKPAPDAVISYNAAAPSQGAPTGALSYFPTAAGRGVRLDASGKYVDFTLPAPAFTGSFCLVIVATRTTAGLTNGDTFLSVAGTSGNANKLEVFSLATGAVFAQCYDSAGSLFQSNTDAGVIALGATVTLVLQVDRDANTAQWYVNGSKSGSADVAPSRNGEAPTIRIGGSSNGNPCGCDVSAVFVVPNAMDGKGLSANPWQLFAPRRIWVPQATPVIARDKGIKKVTREWTRQPQGSVSFDSALCDVGSMAYIGGRLEALGAKLTLVNQISYASSSDGIAATGTRPDASGIKLTPTPYMLQGAGKMAWVWSGVYANGSVGAYYAFGCGDNFGGYVESLGFSQDENGTNANGKFRFTLRDSVGNRTDSGPTSAVLQDGKRHTLVVLYGGSGGDVKIWLDGAPVALTFANSAFNQTSSGRITQPGTPDGVATHYSVNNFNYGSTDNYGDSALKTTLFARITNAVDGALISANPWSIFAPRTTWVPQSAPPVKSIKSFSRKWTKQPQGPHLRTLAIDQQHPLSKGLVAAFVGGRWIAPGETAASFSPGSQVSNIPNKIGRWGAASVAYRGYMPGFDSPSMSLICRPFIPSAPAGNYNIIGLNYYTNEAQSFAFGFGFSGDTNTYAVWARAGVPGINLGNQKFTHGGPFESHIRAVVYDWNGLELFLDASTSATTSTYPIGTYVADSRKSLGMDGSQSLYYGFLYNRVVTHEEDKALMENPWQVFTHRRIWVPQAAINSIPTLSDAQIAFFTAIAARPRVTLNY
jgi:hypothetical protein